MSEHHVTIRFNELVISLAKDLDLDLASRNYVLRRLEAEGSQFLTKTMPLLAKHVLKSLELGYFDRHELTHFAWKGASLKYFRVWLDKIFNCDGSVADNVCPVSLGRLRQFCDYFYKLSFSFNENEIQKAVSKTISIEEELRNTSVSPEWQNKLRKLFANLFTGIQRAEIDEVFTSARPRFGPGAFYGSEDLRGCNYSEYKWRSDSDIGTTSTRFRAVSGYFRPYPSVGRKITTTLDSGCRIISKIPITLVDEPLVSKTLYVPKDSRGPRSISKEPLHLLKAQMAFFDWFSSSLEKYSNYRINFKNQEKNRELAREGSVTGYWATLDLKEASDRVKLSLAQFVFRDSPAIRWFISNARSTHTEVGNRKLLLQKLSGMGSGLTFPIMAVLIHLSVVQAVYDRTHLDIKKISKYVYVYGDDIIIPKIWYNYAVEGLTASGLLVNQEKSYRNSLFRESCGGDYYKGVNVTPVRLKLSNAGLKTWRENRHSMKLHSVLNQNGIYQLDRHCRELVKSSLLNTSEYIYSRIERVFPHYGFTSGDSPTLGRYLLEEIGMENANFKRIVALPAKKNFTGMCPYKYLSSLFKSSEESERTGYGVMCVPRKIRLKHRIVKGITLR